MPPVLCERGDPASHPERGGTGTLVGDGSHLWQAELGAEGCVAALGLDLGCGRRRVSWMRQGVWERALKMP